MQLRNKFLGLGATSSVLRRKIFSLPVSKARKVENREPSRLYPGPVEIVIILLGTWMAKDLKILWRSRSVVMSRIDDGRQPIALI